MTDHNSKDHLSRRQILGAAATGIATVAASGLAFPAAAQPSANGTTMTSRPPLPTYPKPPFKAQQQQWPALNSKMDPVPDNGEKTYRGSGRLAGRKALITGGDSGMGRAAAIAFAREGADVAINYLPFEEPDAQEVIAMMKEAGVKAIALPGDIRDEAFCNRLVADAVTQLGGLDILVNNAAKQQTTPSLAEITTEQLDWTFKTNTYAMVWITRAALPHLKQGATIIVTASEQAYDPSADLVDYAMTKATNVSFVKSMAKQLGPKGIRINAVAPGPVWTPLQVAGGATSEKQKSFGKETALGRPGQPAELASIYVQLAAADASFATGQVYGASGGGGNP